MLSWTGMFSVSCTMINKRPYFPFKVKEMNGKSDGEIMKQMFKELSGDVVAFYQTKNI